MQNLLRETRILDFSHPDLQSLIKKRGWREFPEKERILAIYNFVRDEIRFGYNVSDDVPASAVLADGYGQCNTKGNLFMALLRAVGIPCRYHGFTIDKELQKGAITGIWYRLAPQEIIHSWVEIFFEGKWLNIEGFILDMGYLTALQSRYKNTRGYFCGYGVATQNFANPQVQWEGGDTYIQKEGINRDFGVFDSPDEFFAGHRQSLNWLKRWIFRRITRHAMNRNVQRIREGTKK